MKILTLLLALGASAAGHGTPAAAPSAATTATTATTAMEPAAPAPRYDVRGIFDPAFSLIAYAIKVPHGWLMEQAFSRAWDGANPNNEIFLSMAAPDKHAAITVLPEIRYQYPTGPNGDLMRQMAARQGQAANMIAPLLPAQYIKQVLLPRLHQKAGSPQLRVTGEREGQAQASGPQMQQANGYVEGVLPSGRKVRLTANVVVRTVSFGPGEMMYVWSVIPHIEESDGELAPVVAEAEACMNSLTPNPTWMRKDQALKARGNAITSQQAAAQLQQFRAAQEQTMARFRQNVARQQATSNAINQNYAQKQRASSQVASAYADYMGDKTLYQNPDTGERFKVQGSLGNVYQDAQASTILNSSQPLSGNHVNWQELQQVELKNY